ncbi:MAG TPA: sulfurtransferase [Gammaproteobacteria bacterium]|nr:sulfurtransferase [Gammaproteobacteria bacterium]
MSWLINASQLDKLRKDQKGVVVLDATFYLRAEQGGGFLEEHIPGSRVFPFLDFYDQETPLPNMLIRDEEKISRCVGALGITNEHKIVLYDNSPMHSSCRALWMFKVFGHLSNQLYILDGGLASWKRYGGKIEAGEQRPVNARPYTVTFEPRYLRTLMQMKTNLHHPKEQVVDMRHPVRYAGGAEDRPYLRSGHIPGSFSFPSATMFESNDHFKPLDKIRKQLIGIGLDLSVPIVTTCGSGNTAAILNFVLDLMDVPHNALYDGSWSEWGSSEIYVGEESLDERPVISSLMVNR